MKRLAIISTHPIQYNAPLFALMANRNNIIIKVFYTWGESVLNTKYDPGFGKKIQWDIPLTEGYEFEFLENVSRDPGSHHFKGIDNPTIIQKLNGWEPDALLLYGWSFKSHLKAMRYFYKRKIPIYFRGDSTLLHEQKGWRSLVRKIFLSWVYKNVNKALYVGTHNKNYYLKFGLQPDQLIFAPHAIDNNRFATTLHLSKELVFKKRSEMEIKEPNTVFLFAGKLDENKNVGVLINAFLKMNVSSTHLLIAGNGNKEVELKEMAAGNMNIHFIDFVNQGEIPLLYGMCDVFILPSKAETWGLAINEAMSCGKAVIASNGCGASIDLIEENINGFTFNAHNVDELMAKMYSFIADKNLAAEMGKQAYQKIQQWSFEKICVSIENLILKKQ